LPFIIEGSEVLERFTLTLWISCSRGRLSVSSICYRNLWGIKVEQKCDAHLGSPECELGGRPATAGAYYLARALP